MKALDDAAQWVCGDGNAVPPDRFTRNWELGLNDGAVVQRIERRVVGKR